MKKIARHLRQTLSLVLVLSMLFTSVPVQAFAAEAPVPRIPVSAPLEQPEPVDYEAQQQAADESGGASASTPDSTPAESAPPASSNVPESADGSAGQCFCICAGRNTRQQFFVRFFPGSGICGCFRERKRNRTRRR